jgi:hypothetical protein
MLCTTIFSSEPLEKSLIQRPLQLPPPRFTPAKKPVSGRILPSQFLLKPSKNQPLFIR